MQRTHPILLFGAISLTILLWSSAYIGIRYDLHFYSPSDVALLRYFTASLMMLLFYFLLPKRHSVHLRDVPILFTMGMLGIGLYSIAINYSEITVSAGITSFIIGLMPVFAMLLAIFFLHEKVNRHTWIGVAISLMGLIVIAFNQHHNKQPLWGLGCALFAAIISSGFIIIQKKLSARFHPIELAAFSIWFGTLIMLYDIPTLFVHLHDEPWYATLGIIYLGIFPGAIAYITWATVISQFPATKAVTFLYSMPFVTTLLAWWLLGELPNRLALLGGLLALVGAMWVHLQRTRSTTN